MLRLSLACIAGLLSSPIPGLAQAGFSPDQSKASIYFYRFDVNVSDELGVAAIGMAPRPSIFVDDQLIAKLHKGHFFAVRLEPGKHTLRSSDRESALDLQVLAGEQYFIHVDYVPEPKRRRVAMKCRLVANSGEQGRADIRKLKPLEAKHIRNRDHAFTDLPPDRQAGAAPVKVLQIADIVSMRNAGMGDDLLISVIDQSRLGFNLDADAANALRQAGVSDVVLAAVRRRLGQ